MRGRIQRALSGFYYVKCADGQLYTCKARGKFRKEGVSPLVGDDVEFCEVPGGEGRIDEILPRKNSFDRPSVANIDQMVIVCSQAIPKTDPYLVDRMTAIAALKGCEVLICINKCDLDPRIRCANTMHPQAFAPSVSAQKQATASSCFVPSLSDGSPP